MKIVFFNAVYIWLWKILLKNCSNCCNASWGLRAWPTKCCFWKRPPLIALWIGNKILTTQLYLAHEVDSMFTKEVCNLWIKSYLLLLKIKLNSKNPTCRREDAKIKDSGMSVSPALVWWILLLPCCVQQPMWLWDVSLHRVSAPQSWVLQRNQGWEGTVTLMEAEGFRVMIGLRGRQQRNILPLLVP